MTEKSKSIEYKMVHTAAPLLLVEIMRVTLLCCGFALQCCRFDSRRHTQIMYKKTKTKMLFGAQKRKEMMVV
jgi:hypothetical protein